MNLLALGGLLKNKFYFYLVDIKKYHIFANMNKENKQLELEILRININSIYGSCGSSGVNGSYGSSGVNGHIGKSLIEEYVLMKKQQKREEKINKLLNE